MTERDEFLGWVETRLRDAEVALLNGDAAQRAAIWSTHEPVTVMGAWKNAVGQEDVRDLFRELETRFSDCRSYEHKVIAADVQDDMAYTVGYEHVQSSVGGEERRFTLRATQIYRREDGDWRVAHRHADEVAQEG